MTFIVLSEKLEYIGKDNFSKIMEELQEISHMLAVFRKTLLKSAIS